MLLYLRRILAEYALVVLHQFPYNQEDVDSRYAVGYQPGDIVSFGITFALDEGLVPKSGELRVVLLYLFNQFILAETDLLKRTEFLSGFLLNW